MKWSKAFLPTLKEDPQDAEAISHKLMVRGGFVRRLTAGAYTYLPAGLKVLHKVKNIIREELNSAGAVELMMPALQPPELWKKTGRYDVIGDVMMKIKDRHGKEILLGPTHEEIITDLASKEIRSYKDIPLTLYQIQTKFRDEVRPRFGIVRSCEFIMKDAYSFDEDLEGMEKSYKAMFEAYTRIFKRCGIPYIAVEADSGMMGGSGSHEFMVPTDIGEDRIVICEECGYAASSEVAQAIGKDVTSDAAMGEIEEVETPGLSTVEEVGSFLKVNSSDLIKTMIYLADEEPVAVLLRGDYEVNEVKLKNFLKVVSLELADEKKVFEVTGGAIGFSGPAGIKDIKIISDLSVQGMVNAVTGANAKDKHFKNVNPGRDFTPSEYIDLREITEEDPCPKCQGKLKLKYAIEVGHTFKLGTKYSEKLNATILDNKGKQKTLIMGCYGIGVNRILASLVETQYDKDGIKWPVSISPYEVVVMPVKISDKELYEVAMNVYTQAKEKGIDVLLDDRDKSPGVKFKDADLVGFPVQVIIGSKSLEKGMIEVKIRDTGDKKLIEKDKIIEYLCGYLSENK